MPRERKIVDSELLARCQSGDPQAIEALVHEHQAKIYRLCLSMLDDAAEAEDATQESFIAALKALKSYRGDSAFQTWLISIALNVCRSSLRQRKRRTRLGQTLEDPSLSGESEPTPEQQALFRREDFVLVGNIVLPMLIQNNVERLLLDGVERNLVDVWAKGKRRAAAVVSRSAIGPHGQIKIMVSLRQVPQIVSVHMPGKDTKSHEASHRMLGEG